MILGTDFFSNFYVKSFPQQELIKEIKPGIIRVEPFAGSGRLLKIDDKGDLQIDFSQSDRIIYSLRRAGCTICWNNASWPKQ